MSNDVVLSAAMRSNLLSLQSTQKSIDSTQLRLATGKKVNSALDNPQNFFASNALQNRASDLNRLLDGIGQNIQVIKAADNGISALTKLVEQADSVANQARDALAAGTSEAKVTGNVDLRGVDDLTTLPGIGTDGGITIQLTDAAGSIREVERHGTPVADDVTIAITAGMSTQDLMTAINDVVDADGNHVLEASLNSAGNLIIRTTNGDNFSMTFSNDVTTPANVTDADSLNLATALGFSQQAKLYEVGGGDNAVGFSAKADVAIRSFELARNATGDTALRSTLLTDLFNAKDLAGGALFGGLDDAADQFTISINGGARQNIDLTRDINGEVGAVTVQDFVDSINNNSTINSKIRAEFNEQNGQINLIAIDPSITNIELGYVGDATQTDANFGFGANGLSAADGEAVRENIVIGSASGQLASLEAEFNNIREQITQLVSNGDTGYRGTNLLNGDNLLTNFNEFRTSGLTTEGVTFTAEGLGMNQANFSRASTVDEALAQVRGALESVRDFGSTLANDLAIIQTRQDFTSNMINTLKEGSDKLVNADQNEEGAKLLALQTRQSLGVTSLSLASQSQQSILRLF